MAVCNNPGCSTSTGIHECLTFGYGKLNFSGFWEYPCYICAQAATERDKGTQFYKDYGPYWPETPETTGMVDEDDIWEDEDWDEDY